MDRVELSSEDVDNYWLRLAPPPAPNDEDPRRGGVLIIEDGRTECKVGFDVTPQEGCPLVAFGDQEFKLDDLEDTLTMFWIVVRARYGGTVPIPE